MTTPAINDAENASSYRQRTLQSGNNPPSTASLLTASWSYSRQRPASVSSPLRADKTRAPRAFHHYWWAGSPPTGTFEAERGSLRLITSGPYGHMPRKDILFSQGYSSAVYDRAVMSFLKNLKNSSVDLGVAMAEARKTAELLGKNSESLAKSLDLMMEKNWRQIGKMLSWKKIPGKFLEWSYGVTPLLNDIDGSAKALSEMVEKGYDLSFTTRGNGRRTEIVTETSAQYDSGVPIIYKCQMKELQQISCVSVMPDNLLPVFSSLGLTNPATVAYELVPYSFVLDWVVPIGSWLEVLDAGAFSSFKEGTYSRIQRIKAVGFDVPAVSGLWHTKRSTGRLTVRGGRFDRSVLFNYPSPPIFPRLRSPLSLDKMAKGLSLLTSVFAKWR